MISMCFTFGTIYMQFRRPGVRAEFLFSFFQIFFSLVRLHLTVGLSASLSNLFNCSVPLPRRSFSAITSLCYSIHLELLKGILDSNFPDHNVISCVFPSWQLFAWDMSLVRHLTELREPILNQLQDLKKKDQNQCSTSRDCVTLFIPWVLLPSFRDSGFGLLLGKCSLEPIVEMRSKIRDLTSF